jgi:sialate O-acetylesterase
MARSLSIITVSGFEIAGEDRKFTGADATIDGDTVVVSSDQVAHPVAVRYAWGMNPRPSIYNRAGLPASPFRTDHWDDLVPAW